jgi:hypothetical protein
MYDKTPSLAKAWDWLEKAYDTAKPWLHTAYKIGSTVAPLLLKPGDSTILDRDSLALSLERAYTWMHILNLYPLAS